MATSRKILQILKKYPQIEIFGKECSYLHHQKITKTKNSFASRLLASGIPLNSALSLITKLLADFCRLIEAIAQSIYKRELAIGNVQTVFADLGDYCHHIFGILFGLPIALIAPQYAADAFLTVPANTFPSFLSQDNGSRLYAMGHLLDQFLTKYKIDYRICCGSALGAKREGGVIKNDDDMDLMLHPSSAAQFDDLVMNGKFTQETGISIQKQPWTGGWQCFYEESPKGEKNTPLEKIGSPFIDIFPGVYRQKANEEVISYGEDKMYLQSRGDYFTKEEWDKAPARYAFGPTQMNGIQSLDAYLERCYGPLALKYHTQLYPHHVYASIYGHPLQFFSAVYNNKGPRYTRHERPTPLEYDKKIYQKKISNWIELNPEKNEEAEAQSFEVKASYRPANGRP